MDRLDELEAFVALAEAGSFTGAARRLGRSTSALSRLIGALEARLDLRLVARSTRRVALTDPGRRFLDEARRVLQALGEAEEAARGLSQGVSGRLTGRLAVTAPVLFGEMFLAPVLRAFLEAHPGMRAELLLLDRVVDLIDEGVDLALRIGPLSQAALTARRVGTVRSVVVGAPGLFAREGRPAAPADLARHRIITTPGAGDTWTFGEGRGRVAVPLVPALTVSTNRAAIEAAEAGFGVARVLSYQVADAIGAGRLVEVLADAETRRLPVHLVHPLGRRVPARLRAFLDLAAARLAADRHRLDARPPEMPHDKHEIASHISGQAG